MGSSRYIERRRGRGGCAGALLAVVFVAALCVIVYAFALRPAISRQVGEQIGGGPVPTMMPQQPNPPADIGAAVEEQADAALPGAVAALPPGELVVTDDELNGFIAANPEALAPLEQASVSFTGGQAVAEIGAYGLSSSAAVGLAAQDGRVVVTSAAIDGPLALVLSGDDLARSLADRLNAELAAQGRSVDEIRVEEGQIVLVTS
jgi:hypothetical protein